MAIEKITVRIQGGPAEDLAVKDEALFGDVLDDAVNWTAGKGLIGLPFHFELVAVIDRENA